MGSRLQRLMGWVRNGSSKPEHVYHCPRCGGPLVGTPGYRINPGRAAGAYYTPPNEAELLARCPTHGHPPWNVAP